MSSSAARVVVVGSFNVDHVWHSPALPRPGETLQGEYRSGPGGKGFNQVVAAARAGAQTAFVCALGDDAGGALARQLADTDGIDLQDLRSGSPTGTAGIYVDDDGRNCIVIGAGANADLSADFVSARAGAIGGARIVLAQLESPVESVLEAMRLARAAGVRTLLNPAPANAECPRELLAVADVVTPNETEFTTLLSRHAHEEVDADSLVALDDARLHRLCRTLLPRGTVVVTLGAAGCFVSHREDKTRGDARDHYRVAAERVEPIDTTGAGDAFNGALAASMARDAEAPFQAHVRYATRYAALSTEREGAAAAMPAQGDMERRFAGR
ncbi:ribokinase [Luteimonas aestuarii]|uniref:Ribokinase n=1 Tax=Luteimonas aestuarii TaxID=453837 RepID=A0A4R5U198_9GAMM|nr:ribokinase [Luteimonas aestuarii]TDK27370.1 ribokinase [Luteimonas aestuarii]